MKVVILCGGKGTRLREETEFRPKPMVPIGNRPILWHIMKIYAAQGFKEFVLCLGYKGEIIKDYFRNYQWMTNDVTLKLGQKPSVKFHTRSDEEDWSVTLADTGEETLTAGRISRIQRYIGKDESFFLTYGDGVGDVNVREALKFHKKHGKKLTMTAVRPPGRFGEIVVGDGGVITQFNEKPQVSDGRINGGFFIAHSDVFKYLENGDRKMFEQEPMQTLAREGQLMAYRHNGFWQPMDTFQEFTLLNKMWADGVAPWKTW
ncbi:MAG: Glucose-phosphate cytidylyltransferase [Verrucomicrobiales bacterium]|jgi:glucose-1-phosphate cytidylyltransferase|nr:Glucose-phosphate cytidylyltransferase [Verrucomicrobiales bacterium]